MKQSPLLISMFFMWRAFSAGDCLAASVGSDLLEAKKYAEAKGYAFSASHDEIVAGAKREGRMRALSGLNPETIKPLAEAFRKKYPFLDVHVEEIDGTEAYQRFVLEMKAGTAKGWDATFIPRDFYKEYLPFIKKFDVLGMAKQGVLSIPLEMVHPGDRNAIGAASVVQIVAYNRKSAGKVPAKWEEFLAPEFRGRKFTMDVRADTLAALVPAWGLEKTMDFARKLAAQEPVWARGAARTLTSMMGGEDTILFGANFNTVRRTQLKDTSGNIAYKIAEPVPTLIAARADGVLASASHPNAGLLWLEFHASAEGQGIIEKNTPFQGSLFATGSEIAKITKGKALSVVDWSHFAELQTYQEKLVEALGFPKAK
jgi:hypothetical protein